MPRLLVTTVLCWFVHDGSGQTAVRAASNTEVEPPLLMLLVSVAP